MIKPQTVVASAILVVAGTGAALAQTLLSGNAWIDAPLPGTVVELASVDIVAHASHPGGIVGGRLDVNGTTVATTAAASSWGSLAELRFEWAPEIPGRYELAVFGQTPDGDWTEPGLSWVATTESATTTTSSTTTSPTTSTTRPGTTTTTTRPAPSTTAPPPTTTLPTTTTTQPTTTSTRPTTTTSDPRDTTTTTEPTTTSTRPTTTTTDPRDTTTTTDPGRTTTTGRGG